MKTLINLRGASLLLAALTLSLSTAFAADGRTAFSKLVVFGDSLNDTGNLLRLAQGTHTVLPSDLILTNGRQTNGPVWVEYLAEDLGLENKIINSAVIGAMTKSTLEFPTGNVWSENIPKLEHTDVFSQVTRYAHDSHNHADRCALYILEGGANDFPRVANPGVIVTNLIASLAALESIGARHILLVNLPDIGKTPRVILAERLGLIPAGSGGFYSDVSAQLNQALVGAVALATAPDVTITFADAYGFMNKVEAAPATFDLFEAQLPWLKFGAGSDPDEWLFWDDLHPTTRGHEIFSDQVLSALIKDYRHHRNGFDRDEFPCHHHH